MILSIFGFENKIIFKEDRVNVLEIYNKKMFYNLVDLINTKCNGEDDENNQIVLLENDQSIKFEGNIFILTDVFNLDLNTKKVLNKIYRLISNNISNRQDYELNNLMLKLRNYFVEEINELPFEFNMSSELETETLLKAFNLKLDVSCYITLIEKLEFIIDLIATLGLAKILVIPNLKIYLNETEIVEIYKYAIYNNINLMILENCCYETLLDYEVKNIIDNEFDEF